MFAEPLSSRCALRDPDLGRASSAIRQAATLKATDLLECRQGAVDLAAFLVAAVLFPDSLCGRRWRRPAMTGANGSVLAFLGT